MRHTTRRRVRRQVNSLRTQFAQVEGLPFADVLSADLIDAVLADAQVTFRDRVYAPLITLAMMLSQTQDDDPSLRQAVARLQAQRAAQGLPDIDDDTGAFSKARTRLPEGVLAQLTRRSGRCLLHNAPAHWCWRGRDVKIVDGSTLSMPDTPANQNVYPQANTQKPGLGFPILRFVVLLSLAVGTVLNATYAPYQGKRTGETALLRQLYDDLNSGDVLLADTYFCTYFVIAELRRRGVDIVVPLHQCRHCDFRQGQHLGRADHVVSWSKPARPEWMSAAEYDQYPATLTVRELRVRVPRKTLRRRTFVVVTTLLHAQDYPKAAVAELFRQRWQAELDLRALKDVLHLDVLRGRTPAMVQKEFWAHLLAYNLIRTTMAQAAYEHGCVPRRLSFKGALQTLRAFALPLLLCPTEQLPALLRRVLAAVASQRVGDRPDRVEPRARKRRPKPYKNLTRPRTQARKLEVSKRSG
jgi:DDE family transposase